MLRCCVGIVVPVCGASDIRACFQPRKRVAGDRIYRQDQKIQKKWIVNKEVIRYNALYLFLFISGLACPYHQIMVTS